MTATDELRRMLDERGIKHFDYSKSRWSQTQWEAPDGNRHFTYETYNNPAKTAKLVISWFPTPEQAIAATLGDAFTCEECEASFVHGYSLGTLPVGSDPQWDENRQTVDEHMAELGWVRERTCRVEGSRSHDYGYAPVGMVWEWDLSCGDTVEGDWPPDYCPNCGAKVVSE